MKWTDVNDIAIELADAHPDVDPKTVRFVDLHNWVVELPGFDDDHAAAASACWRRSSRRG
ncbi:FeS assembly protein IscX [Chromobacterium violaceum]|uniref:FeS assembly protein IscX n=1 Tax=Chromobacterium violaceum TaxID=536 RepID=A0A3S4IY31_CHRVL|nr:FeS assembly protein IscX [Chromobacterium violaceum]